MSEDQIRAAAEAALVEARAAADAAALLESSAPAAVELPTDLVLPEDLIVSADLDLLLDPVVPAVEIAPDIEIDPLLELEIELDLALLTATADADPEVTAPSRDGADPHGVVPPIARGAARRAARTTISARRRTVIMWVATIVLTGMIAAALLFQAAGGRWFVVQTPSMGTTAPVGTLVLTTPVLLDELHVGDVVSFHPSTTPDETYTHRVIAVEDGHITTQGDINGAVDPWQTTQADLVGEATTVLPAFGWLAKGLPLLLAGFVIVMILTRLISSPTHRASMRMLGLSLVASFTVFLLKPLVGLVVLDAQVEDGTATASLVSTGILPIRVAAAGGTHADLVSGQVGTITAPAAGEGSFYSISSSLHLPLWGWILFGVLCAVPLLFTLIVGLPAEPEAREDAAETAADDASAAADGTAAEGAAVAAAPAAVQTGTVGDSGERDRTDTAGTMPAGR